MNTTTIFIDSSVLRRYSSLSDGHFQALNELSVAKLAVLAVPYIVESEYISALREKDIEDYKSAIRALKALSKRQAEGHTQNEIQDIIGRIESLEEVIESASKIRFDEWCGAVEVDRLPLTQEDSINSWKSYFLGDKPFTSLKNRKDLPDAHILFTFSARREIWAY